MARLAIEYRKIGQLATCIGNERIRVAADGRVSFSRNTTECEQGRQWSAEWRAAGQLASTALTELAREIGGSGLLAMVPESIAETAEGGKREEIDVTIDDAAYHFVVQNADRPAFRHVVRLLWGALSMAELAAPEK